MRRTHLVAAAFAGATALTGLTIPAAHADPVAEVHPGKASPGEHVTVSVTCDPMKMREPKSISADSKAFEGGSVRLHLVPAEDGYNYGHGHEYKGEAKIGWGEHWEDGKEYGHEDSYGKEKDPYAEHSYGKEDDHGYGHHSAKKYPVTGYCPDGKMFKTYVLVDKKPGGGSHAGTGGAGGGTNTAALAGGGALLATALGCGAYLMRRRQQG